MTDDELSRLKQENDRLFEQHLADCREISLLRMALSSVEWLPLPENYGTDIINADGDADPTLYKAPDNREVYLICPWCGAPEPFDHNLDCIRQDGLYSDLPF